MSENQCSDIVKDGLHNQRPKPKSTNLAVCLINLGNCTVDRFGAGDVELVQVDSGPLFSRDRMKPCRELLDAGCEVGESVVVYFSRLRTVA